MKISKLLTGLIGVLCFPSVAFAAVAVTSSDLQDASSLILPAGSSLQPLAGYQNFTLVSVEDIASGIEATYEAKFSGDLTLAQELPRLTVQVYSYSRSDLAESSFNSLSGLASFSNGLKTILDEDARNLYYSSEPGVGVDVFGQITSEEKSLHLAHLNGNLIYHVSLYRGGGEYVEGNVESFAARIAESTTSRESLVDVIEGMKLSLGLLFPPALSDFSARSEKSSLNLSDLYTIPGNGTVQFDLYVGDPASAVGTVIDSSGILPAQPGDLYIYVQSDGTLLAGVYAPEWDSSCDEQSGWFRLFSSQALYPYEWNTVSLQYGVGGLVLKHEGEVVASCSISEDRSTRDLYFGDFPGDSIQESMVGYLNSLTFNSSYAPDGRSWDQVLSEQLFYDLPNSDPDYSVFNYLKAAGIFLGSDGMLLPEQALNRAQMVKVLLMTYDYTGDENGAAPFWDVAGDAWYKKYLNRAYDIGMIEGHANGTFLPEHQLNNAEFFTMLARVAGEERLAYDEEFSDVSEKDWYAGGAAFALKHDLVGGSMFRPADWVTRREAAQIIYQILHE